jgi:8-oxo-dGTP pyrophosphatase MutT (NUDIX family)
VSALAPSAAWVARLREAGMRPPLVARVPLEWQGESIGTVEPGLFERCGAAAHARVARAGAGWAVQGELSESLAALAQALRAAGLAHVWRDELLAVRAGDGRVLGEVERAVVRPLGIATQAVHLLGLDPHGRHWMQKRADDKPNDPGLWDTLVGGMVPASDSLAAALERETWEEAGLRFAQLQALRHGGRVTTRRPAREVPHGYVVEHLDWYACVVPEGVAPVNQDGEVAEFRAMDAAEVTARLERDEFTVDAALLLLDAFGAPE